MTARQCRETFTTPYDQHRAREGQAFDVVAEIDKPDADHDAEVLPMFRIRFADGFEIEAWPEEVLASEGGAGEGRMKKNLYRVEVERVLYVLAEDESEAEDIARGNERDAEPDTHASEVEGIEDVPPDWRDARPFAEYHDTGYAKGDPTCAEIVAAQAGGKGA